MSQNDLLPAARRMAAAAGVAAPHSLTQMEGGKNNRVFRADLEDGGKAVLKSYFHDGRDNRDRLGAEWAFLTYAWNRGVLSVPQPLLRDDDRHLGLYSFAPGRKLAAHEIGSAQVDEALAFILAVNAAPKDARQLAPGSEACFSIDEHLATVERRVLRLRALSPDAPLRDDAKTLVRERLEPAWAAVRARIARDCAAQGLNLAARIDVASECVSPSDFGFHNVLVAEDGRTTFIDFEYAGRDDPAKLASDLFCCPEIPVPGELHGRFVDGLAAGLGLSTQDRARCRILLDAYRVKWACIILNHFLENDAARRAFASHGGDADRYAAQLVRAAAKLDEIPLF